MLDKQAREPESSVFGSTRRSDHGWCTPPMRMARSRSGTEGRWGCLSFGPPSFRPGAAGLCGPPTAPQPCAVDERARDEEEAREGDARSRSGKSASSSRSPGDEHEEDEAAAVDVELEQWLARLGISLDVALRLRALGASRPKDLLFLEPGELDEIQLKPIEARKVRAAIEAMRHDEEA